MLERQAITVQEERIFILFLRQMVQIKVKIKVEIPWSKQAFPVFRQPPREGSHLTFYILFQYLKPEGRVIGQ